MSLKDKLCSTIMKYVMELDIKDNVDPTYRDKEFDLVFKSTKYDLNSSIHVSSYGFNDHVYEPEESVHSLANVVQTVYITADELDRVYNNIYTILEPFKDERITFELGSKLYSIIYDDDQWKWVESLSSNYIKTDTYKHLSYNYNVKLKQYTKGLLNIDHIIVDKIDPIVRELFSGRYDEYDIVLLYDSIILSSITKHAFAPPSKNLKSNVYDIIKKHFNEFITIKKINFNTYITLQSEGEK